MRNQEFKQLLKEGIDSVANRNGKKVRSIEEEIGEGLCVSHHTVQRWKRGFTPGEMQRLEFIVEYCQQHGRVDRAWGQRLLRQGGHPAPDTFLKRIFPPQQGYTAASDIPRIYQNLPPRYGQFIGREAELARVLEWVEASRWPLASIEGMGGIGKTSLALEVGHRCLSGDEATIDHPFKAVVWTSARDYADFDLTLNHVLDSIAHVLDYTQLTQAQAEQKLDVVDQLLRRQPTLVIVDNFETVTDLALVRFLEQIPEPSKALITTRYKQLRRVWDIPLYGLKDEETLTLIRRHSHRIGLQMVAGADDDILYRLAAATGNNPKAIQLALGLIKQKGLPFNSVVDDLYQASQLVEEVFDYIFAEAWKLLEDETRRVLLTMSLFVSSASREALSAISGVDGYAFSRAIERLVEMSLFRANEALNVGEQRYRIHPLTRAFARKKLQVDQPFVDQSFAASQNVSAVPDIDLAALKVNFYTYFAQWGKCKLDDDYWGFTVLNIEMREAVYEELSNLVIALDWAYERSDWPYTLALAKAVVHPFYRHAQTSEFIKYSEYGLSAARKLQNVADEIWFCIDSLGHIHIQAGDYEKAGEYILSAMRQAKKHQLADAIALGETYLVYREANNGNLAKAQQHVQAALKNAQGPYFKYRAYRAAGHVDRKLQKYEQATTHYMHAKYWAGTKYVDKSDTGLGFASLGLNNYEEAEYHFQTALNYYNTLGNQRLIAIAKLGLALTQEAQENVQQAIDLAQEAYEVFSHIDTPWALKETTALLERLTGSTTPEIA